MGRPAMCVWAAITQYLTEDGVRKTVATLAKAAAGSRLVFTYIRRDFLEGRNLYGWQKSYDDWVVRDKLWRYGLDPEDVGELLRDYGWMEREDVGPADYRA